MKLEVAVEIKSEQIFEKSGTSKLGKPFRIREQSGYVDLGKAYPVEIKVPLDETSPPYTIGRYTINPGCLYVDRYGQLALARLKLVHAMGTKTV